MPETENLRYVPAAHVEGDGLPLSRLPVETDSHGRLGRMDGVLIEPSTRRLHYLVIDAGWKGRYLMPLSTVCLDPSSPSLRLMEEPEPGSWHAFDPHAFDEFGDEDLLTTLFSRPAA